ncbi:MAG: hypothetical protein WC521_07170, partial [Bdellovibrionales bacterium]
QRLASARHINLVIPEKSLFALCKMRFYPESDLLSFFVIPAKAGIQRRASARHMTLSPPLEGAKRRLSKT